MIQYLVEAAARADEVNRNGACLTVDLLVTQQGIMVRGRKPVDVRVLGHHQLIHWAQLDAAATNPLIYMIDSVARSLS